MSSVIDLLNETNNIDIGGWVSGWELNEST